MNDESHITRPKSRSRFAALLLGIAIGPILVLGVLFLFSNASASWLSERIAANLVQPDTSEASSTAFSPPASTLEIAAISGRGEGLDCSIEPIVEGRAFRSKRDEVSVNLQYRQACVAHDYCYRHGAATYGYSQADCDGMLARSALRICNRVGAEGDSNCLTRARKVYSGLVFGGAGSFRPVRPDMKGVKGGGFAYPAWPEALEDRFAASGRTLQENEQLASDRELITKPGADLRKLSDVGLSRLLDAWLDVASTIGEYHPYPLGTARYSLPRVLNIDGNGRALVFYMHRPGGAKLQVYRWVATPSAQALRACADEGCGAKARGFELRGQYRSLPSPPWVLSKHPDGERLVWWRRYDTDSESTGGNLMIATYSGPKRAKYGSVDPAGWALDLSPSTDMWAPSAYPVRGTFEDFTVASLTNQFVRPGVKVTREVSDNDRDLVLWFWRGHRSSVKDWSVYEGGVRIAPGAPEGPGFIGGPEYRALLASPLTVTPSGGGGVNITVVTRGTPTTTFRKGLIAWTFAIPTPLGEVVDGRPNRPLPAHLAAAGVPFDVPEVAEPAVPLVTGNGAMRFLTVQCAPGAPKTFLSWFGVWAGAFEPPRCSRTDGRTIVTLRKPAPAKPVGGCIAGRYVARATVIGNLGEMAAAPGHLLVLVRYGLVSERRRPVLVGWVRVVGVGRDSLDEGQERYLRVLSPDGESSITDALTRASRIFPIVADIDLDGSADLVLADGALGRDSLAFTSIVPKGGLAFSHPRPVRPCDAT